MTNTINTKEHTDINRLIWIKKFIPVILRPYAYLMRIDRPIGIWLLLIPSLWSISLASKGVLHMGVREYYIAFMFALGSVIMRGAGCIINDLWDRDIDIKVERTRIRPIASGELSIRQAMIFLGILMLLGFAILIQFNLPTIILGFLSIPLIISYPLMKRITWWPQAFLGITFNMGALMGWSAVSGTIGISAILLYIAGICWSIAYDTIYAHQDKDDDIMAGIKSTALLFGENSKLWVCVFLALAFVFIVLALVTKPYSSIFSYLIVLTGIYSIWQIKTWEPDNKSSSLKIFKSNSKAGLLVLLACL